MLSNGTWLYADPYFYLFLRSIPCYWSRCCYLGIYLGNLSKQRSCIRSILGGERTLGFCSGNYTNYPIFLGCYGRSPKKCCLVYLLFLWGYDDTTTHLGNNKNARNQRYILGGIK